MGQAPGRFYVTFKTVQVMSRSVVLWAEETSAYSWSRFCKLPTIRNKLQTFTHKVWGLNRHPQRCGASVPWCREHNNNWMYVSFCSNQNLSGLFGFGILNHFICLVLSCTKHQSHTSDLGCKGGVYLKICPMI